MEGLLELLKAFTNISTLLASIGMVLATTSFISGLQMVKGKGRLERKIHKGNGFVSFAIIFVLAVMSFATFGLSLWSLSGWTLAFSIIFLKHKIVHAKNRRAFKYVSWLGASLICMWLYVVYIHIPL